MKDILKNINKREYFFVLIMVFVLIVITTAPTIFGFSNLYVLTEDFIYYSDPQFREEPEYIYLDQEYKDAFE